LAKGFSTTSFKYHFVVRCSPSRNDTSGLNPIGAKGIGEIGIVGVAPAIANAVYHATGKRVRDLPITIEKVL